MTQPTANCPNCGASITFLWSGAVQTVCPFCRTVLVRHDVNLEKVGEAADLPMDSSPIQIRTEGKYKGRNFLVVGRILYEYERGGWNEWHIIYSDGESGWLSDAQAEYAISHAVPTPGNLPPPANLHVGTGVEWNGNHYTVATRTVAHYRGVEGELPFTTWDKKDVPFIDFRSNSGRFATLDYSDAAPVLYLGEYVEWDDLKLANVREFDGWPLR